MAGEWIERRLGDLVEVYDGPHATPAKTESGPVFLGISNLSNGRLDLSNTEHLSEEDFVRWTRRITPQAGDIVFSYETRLGEAAMIPQGLRCCLGRRMGLLRPHPGRVDSRFLLYAYLGPEFQETVRSRTVHGSTVDRIPLIDMPDFPIRVPARVEEQRAIAHVLGTLDDKIEFNRQMNETLEAMAQAIFKSWFVDFDTVRAKAEGRQPYGMDADTAALFSDSFQDSPFGKIPSSWECGTLNEVGENPRRGVKPNEISPETPYIGLEHMPRKSIALTEWGKAEDVDSNKFQFKQGEILFGKLRPYFHKVGVAPIDGVCSTDILALAAKSQDWFGFLLAHVSSEEFIAYTDATSTGTKMPRTNWHDMARYEVVVPDHRVAKSYNDIVTPMIERINANIMQSRTLAAIRDTLLPKLISGEIRIKDAENFVEQRL